MKFELVVLGAHIGVHIKDEISKINNSPILQAIITIPKIKKVSCQ